MSANGVWILIKWREAVNEKRKARAIQRAIDKAYAKLDEIELLKLHAKLYGKKIKVYAW